MFFLLISCNSLAYELLTESGFEQFTKKITLLKDNNSKEALQFIQQHLNVADQIPLKNRLVFYKYLAEVYTDLGQFHQSKAITHKALALTKEFSNPTIISAELYYLYGFSVESLGDYEQAIKNYKNGLEIAESLNDKKFSSTGLINLGAMYYLTEKFDRSLIVLNQALTIATSLGDDELLGYVNSELGILYTHMFENDKAMIYFQKSYEHNKKAGKIIYAYNSLQNIAANHDRHERYDESIKIYKEIIANADALGNKSMIGSSYIGLAWAYFKKEDSNPEAGFEYMKIAEQYVNQSERHELPLTFGIDKAFMLYEMKRYDEALDVILSVESLLDNENTIVNNTSKLNILFLKADIYNRQQLYKKAYQAQKQYLKFAFQLRDNSNYEVVEDLRMRYESEQADLQKQILEQQEKAQTMRLNDAQYKESNRQIVLFFSIVVVLIIAWFLFKIIRGQRKLLKLSQTDGLTGVVNRRRLMELSDFFFYQAKQTQDNFSVLVIDVDDFKLINDNYGHKVGDKVLKQVAQIGCQAMRSSDEFGRFGGEEFIALLPGADQKQAQKIAERLCQNIHNHSWRKMLKNNVSVSIGVASINVSTHECADDVIKAADILLYKAKSQGKNQVCC